MSQPEKKVCNFCQGASGGEVLIEGSGVCICDRCVHACLGLLRQEETTTEKDTDEEHLFTTWMPKSIKQELNKFVIGQEDAKKALAIAAYNHYKRIGRRHKTGHELLTSEELANVPLQKSNVLLVGPTGTGKTYLVETLSRILEVPFASIDATTLTESGYAGADVEDVLLRLYYAADEDINLAQRGIVYIDEIDKLTSRGDGIWKNHASTREGVQQALLKMLEGTTVSVPLNKKGDSGTVEINTHNILFICGGAFEGIYDDGTQNDVPTRKIGFLPALVEDYHEKIAEEKRRVVDPQMLISYGLIPEFVGRFPVIVSLNALSKQDLIHILTEPENALVKEYRALLALDGVELEFSEDALDAIATLAIARGTGARGLRGVIEETVRDIMFEAPALQGTRVVIERKDIRGIEDEETSSTTLEQQALAVVS